MVKTYNDVLQYDLQYDWYFSAFVCLELSSLKGYLEPVTHGHRSQAPLKIVMSSTHRLQGGVFICGYG